VPRIRPADDIDPDTFDNGVPDDIFKRIIAILRIAVPYTGIIMSTRESKEMRAAALHLGVSQLSGGSRTSVGGYAEEEPEEENTAQFDVEDNRTLAQVVDWLIDEGHVPSFCTACYREGRTGDRFMQLVKTGQIANICQPNALMTLNEYLEDYASPETKEKGKAIIAKRLEMIPNEKVKELVREHLDDINEGRRDFRL
jgi:2-iminoacetate synthase